MSTMTIEISPETRAAARDLLGYFNLPGGSAPGGFRAALFALWPKADRSNKAKLADAFPEVAAAMDTLHEGGTEALTILAAGT